MKDSYSFDVSDEAFLTSYQAHREAYIRIFDRLGFDYVIVAAMSGAMGGSASEEFLAKAENGEDTYVRCTNCDYAANVEAVRVRRARRRSPYDDVPGGARRADARHPDDRDPRRPPQREVPARRPALDGRRHAEERHRHAASTPTARASRSRSACPATATSTSSGSARRSSRPRSRRSTRRTSPRTRAGQGLHRPGRARREGHAAASATCSTPASSTGTRWVTGADVDGSHVHRPGRRPRLRGRRRRSRRPTSATATPAPMCGHPLETARGIEMGHIFQLGRRYAEALDLQVLDENGKLVTVTMGSYGVGVSRAVAAIVENSHDELGHHLAARGQPGRRAPGRDRQGRRGVRGGRPALPPSSRRPGSTVLYDDRPKVSPGVKFKDAELIGVPTIVVVGKGLVDGVVEVKDRRSGRARERRRRGCGRAHRRGRPWRLTPSSSTGAARSPRGARSTPADEWRSAGRGRVAPDRRRRGHRGAGRGGDAGLGPVARRAPQLDARGDLRAGRHRLRRRAPGTATARSGTRRP